MYLQKHQSLCRLLTDPLSLCGHQYFYSICRIDIGQHSIKLNHWSFSQCILYLHFVGRPTYTNLCQSTYPYQPTSTYAPTNINTPTYVNLPSSSYLPVPIPKYQYIIAADPGAGIGLVVVWFLFDPCPINSHHHATPNSSIFL